jgi:hypothetical protein
VAERDRSGFHGEERKRNLWRRREDAGTRAVNKTFWCQNFWGGVHRLPKNTHFWSQKTLWAMDNQIYT